MHAQTSTVVAREVPLKGVRLVCYEKAIPVSRSGASVFCSCPQTTPWCPDSVQGGALCTVSNFMAASWRGKIVDKTDDRQTSSGTWSPNGGIETASVRIISADTDYFSILLLLGQ